MTEAGRQDGALHTGRCRKPSWRVAGINWAISSAYPSVHQLNTSSILVPHYRSSTLWTHPVVKSSGSSMMLSSSS
ncbi:hypothetical protein MRX96_050430 [Rhipicephalus microplus]